MVWALRNVSCCLPRCVHLSDTLMRQICSVGRGHRHAYTRPARPITCYAKSWRNGKVQNVFGIAGALCIARYLHGWLYNAACGPQIGDWNTDCRTVSPPGPCDTCLQDFHTISHILVGCVYAWQVWLGCFNEMGITMAIPERDDSLQTLWLPKRQRYRGTQGCSKTLENSTQCWG
jgi:hypothetical protein